MQIFLEFISDVQLYIIAFNVVIYLYSAFKIRNIKSLNFLTLYLTLILINQLVALFVGHFTGDNLFLFHVYLIIQFICLSIFYKSLFNNKQKRIVNFLLVSVLTIFVGYYFCWPEDFAYFNLSEILITTIPVLAYIMIHLYNSLTRKGKYLIFSGGLLVYLSISSLVFLLYALLADDLENKILSEAAVRNVSNVNVLSYMLMQIVIFIEWKLNISKWKTKKIL